MPTFKDIGILTIHIHKKVLQAAMNEISFSDFHRSDVRDSYRFSVDLTALRCLWEKHDCFRLRHVWQILNFYSD